MQACLMAVPGKTVGLTNEAAFVFAGTAAAIAAAVLVGEFMLPIEDHQQRGPMSLLFLLIVVCASVLHGTHTNVSVATTVPGALVVVDGVPVGQAPAVIPVPHDRDHLMVVHADGYADYPVPLTTHADGGWIVLDVLVGFVTLFIPLIVDAVSGAWNSLSPSSVAAPLQPLTGQPLMSTPPGYGPTVVEQR
mgnify:CR=1 FL=1